MPVPSVSPSPSASTPSIHEDAGHEEYNRGVIEYLPHPREYLTDAQYSELEEVPVTIEEPWNECIEGYLRRWLDEAEASGTAHRRSAFTLKQRYRLFTVVVLLWSAVILVVNDSIPCDADETLTLVRLIVNAVGVFLNALFASLNMGYTYRMHFEYDTKYFELAQDISYNLMRERDFRPPADAFMMEMRERRKKLALAPELAGKRFFGC